MMKTLLLTLGFIVVAGLVATQLTIFVVPPIGAVPEGRTVILLRWAVNKDGDIVRLNTDFIDSADAFCERTTGRVTLLCRGMALGAIASNSTILLRLPYSRALQAMADAK